MFILMLDISLQPAFHLHTVEYGATKGSHYLWIPKDFQKVIEI
jgi:hypothetical protein